MESNLKRPKPVLLERIGHIEHYEYPDTGEEFWRTAIYAEQYERSNEIRKAVVTIKWLAEIPLSRQLACLKMICPKLNEISNQDLLSSIKGAEQWEIGEFLPDEAEKICNEGKRYNLNMVWVEVSNDKR